MFWNVRAVMSVTTAVDCGYVLTDLIQQTHYAIACVACEPKSEYYLNVFSFESRRFLDTKRHLEGPHSADPANHASDLMHDLMHL